MGPVDGGVPNWSRRKLEKSFGDDEESGLAGVVVGGFGRRSELGATGLVWSRRSGGGRLVRGGVGVVPAVGV